MIRCFIGLGSNLDHPLQQLRLAIAALKELPASRLAAHSPWYRSQAIGPRQDDFINGVAELWTQLEPLPLLSALQQIEQRQHRQRNLHWGPRTLDLDILLYGEQQITLPELCIPHREITRRNFVLQPLLDLAPQLCLPDGRSIAGLLEQCPANPLAKLDCCA